MKKRLFAVDVVLIILAIACAVFAGLVIVLNPRWALYAFVALVVVLLLVWLNIGSIRRAIAKTMRNASADGSAGQSAMVNLQMSVAVVSGKNIVWYNDSFLNNILDENDAYLLPVHKIIPTLNVEECVQSTGQNLQIGTKKYTCYGADMDGKGTMYVLYFVDDTVLKDTAEEYAESRPCVIHIVIDTYDDILKEMKESDRARLTASVDTELEQFVGKSTGFLTRVSASRYIAVVEERHMQEMVADKFSVLDKVRKLGAEMATVTLSVGVARGFATFTEADTMAAQALDMALGRGGDQVAIRTVEGYEFFGGVSRSVEKKNKVKSRIMASAIQDLIMQSDSVLIMGHRLGDLDALGSATGVLRICKACEKPAAIVVRKDKTLAAPLMERLEQNGYADDMVSPEEALDNITKDTLLIIVDVHTANMLEAPAVYEACKQVVVIDHHRKMVGHIDDAVIFYLEPYASSAAELVAEMLPYIGDKGAKPNQIEAEAMMAGIMLDTRNFAVRAGVRTFEAAAYLRRMGARTTEVQKLFATPQEVYTAKAELVTIAQIYKNCAVSVAESPLRLDQSIVVPQAANDLLTIEGVRASFVAVPSGGQMMISGRSLGDINVQVIMESIGGGGHLTMAGAQLQDVTAEEVKQILFDAIDAYYEKQN